MNSTKQVTFITQYYGPEKIGSAPYITEIAEWFAAQNYLVKVFTNRPFYPFKKVFDNYRNGAKDVEDLNEVKVRRIKPYIPKKNNIIYRALADSIFFIKSLFLNGLKKRDNIITLCPSIFSVAIGNLIKKRKGHHIAIVHDIQSGLADGLNLSKSLKFVLNFLRYIERKVLNKTDKIVVLTDGMRDSLLKLGVSRGKIIKIPIWVDTDLIKPIIEKKGNVDYNDELIMYSGNLGKKQGLFQILDLAELLQKDPNTSDLKIEIRGDGNQKSELVTYAKSLNLNNVYFKDLVPKEELPYTLSKPVLHLVPQDPKTSEFAMPSKAYTLMALQKTFVATAIKGSTLYNFSKKTNAFITVPPNDVHCLKKEIVRLITDKSLKTKLEKNGREYVVKNNSKEKILNQYLSLI